MAYFNIVIAALIFVETATCYTITMQDPIFPTQAVFDDNSIIRIMPNNEVDIVECPKGTYLNKSTLTCQFNETESDEEIVDQKCDIGARFAGTQPNPENCRTFIMCGPAGSWVVDCPGNLLFNVDKNMCDWPHQAGCCEFSEKNSSRILQNEV